MRKDNQDAQRLKKLGVSNLLDLALLIPKSYENTYINQTPLLNEFNTVHVEVKSVSFGRAMSLRLYCTTWEQNIFAVVFNARAYQRSVFKVGASLHVRGKVEWKNGNITMIQPQIVENINQIVPKYKTSLQSKTMQSLAQKYINIQALMNEGLNEYEAKVLNDFHFKAPSMDEAKLNVLKFVEIYNYLRALAKKKVDFEAKNRLDSDVSSFVASLPFKLTNDQINAIGDIKKDFISKKAARRIIMGDVGSGKTMVILASVVMCYPKKSVLLAPTTILAKQLFDEATKYLPKDIHVGLVLSSSSKKDDLNEFDFIIGTHALLFRELPEFDLVMVDEQHRFGTKQRELINQLSIKESKHPHFLQFSATPIPRTMSMIQSSLVDFSFMKETPYKKDITTKVIRKQDFKALIEHIKDEIQKDKQIIIIYPLVEESEVIEYQSIDEARSYWEKNFENVFVTYGADKNKEKVLEDFREKGSLLVATTLVEVGISLPKLSTIVIVGAERLGLATLHQLRGRVSRNGLKGYCFLYTNQEKSQRLDAFCKCQNGFDIAELDLKYRKGGDILGGVKQSGSKFEFYDFEEDILVKAKNRLGSQKTSH
ncbi:ATP-dependent DNA helicase RecG [Sulfurospirillum sp. 1307]